MRVQSDAILFDTTGAGMDFWLQRALQEIDSVTEGISNEQMIWHPAEGKWSVAQILEHLSATFRTSVTALRKALDTGQPQAGRGSFVKWLSTRVVADLGYFPSGRPAPNFSLPKGAPPAQVAREIRDNLVAMDGVLADLERKFGAGVKLADHPVLGPFTVTEWRKFHYRHTHHHMKQVIALRGRLPAASGQA
jgi:hypothetical protein